MTRPNFASRFSPFQRVADRFKEWQREVDSSGVSAFDAAKWGDISTSPDSVPPLMGFSERALGRPADVFSVSGVGRSAMAKSTDAFRQWKKTVNRLRPYSARGKVAGVHTYVDQMNGEAKDVARLAWAKPWTGIMNCSSWQTPETDGVLAKYVSLRLLGFHADRLRMVLMERESGAAAPVLLAVYFGGQAFILRTNKPITTDDGLEDMFPACSLNARRFYLHWGKNGADTPAAAAKRLLKKFQLNPAH